MIKHTTRSATAIVDALEDHVDVHTLERAPAPAELALNDIGSVRLRTSAPLAFDPYVGNRRTGSFILIDEATNETVGAGMVGPVERLKTAGGVSNFSIFFGQFSARGFLAVERETRPNCAIAQRIA